MHELTRTEARRIAVQAQLLDAGRPTELHAVVRQLTLLQIDPTAAIAPNADLVAWSRLGSSYAREDLTAALTNRTLLELRAMIRPSEDLALYRADMAVWEKETKHYRQWVAANDACRRDILDRLTGQGPLTSRELPDTCAVPWQSSGWTHNRNVTQLLELMVLRGEVAIAGRAGRERLWDLASRVYPDEPAVVGEAGEPAVVEGVKGEWRVDPAYLERPFTGRAALLSPFDRLVHDRQRTTELFGYDYQLEMYKPPAKRRWGYFALPILYGDQLVGKLDATADRKAGVLLVNAVHQDVEFSRSIADAVDAEIDDLALWLNLRRS